MSSHLDSYASRDDSNPENLQEYSIVSRETSNNMTERHRLERLANDMRAYNISHDELAHALEIYRLTGIGTIKQGKRRSVIIYCVVNAFKELYGNDYDRGLVSSLFEMPFSSISTALNTVEKLNRGYKPIICRQTPGNSLTCLLDMTQKLEGLDKEAIQRKMDRVLTKNLSLDSNYSSTVIAAAVITAYCDERGITGWDDCTNICVLGLPSTTIGKLSLVIREIDTD